MEKISSKYRILTQEELKELEPEFILFLASQSITAEEWKRTKKSDPKKTTELIAAFSTMVLERVYSKVEHVLILHPNQLLVFNMGEKHAEMIGIFFPKPHGMKSPEELLNKLTDEKCFSMDNPKLISTSKAYTKSRAEEVFFLVQHGAEISSPEVFTLLDSLRKNKSTQFAKPQ